MFGRREVTRAVIERARAILLLLLIPGGRVRPTLVKERRRPVYAHRLREDRHRRRRRRPGVVVDARARDAPQPLHPFRLHHAVSSISQASTHRSLPIIAIESSRRGRSSHPPGKSRQHISPCLLYAQVRSPSHASSSRCWSGGGGPSSFHNVYRTSYHTYGLQRAACQTSRKNFYIFPRRNIIRPFGGRSKLLKHGCRYFLAYRQQNFAGVGLLLAYLKIKMRQQHAFLA